jgi:hypothetical protein
MTPPQLDVDACQEKLALLARGVAHRSPTG